MPVTNMAKDKRFFSKAPPSYIAKEKANSGGNAGGENEERRP